MKISKGFFLLILAKTLCFNIQAQQIAPELLPDKYPEYPGGSRELFRFFENNIVYPREAQEKGVEETVVVELVIEEDGALSDIKLFGDYRYDFGFSEEAIRVVNMMPKWIPGQINGKNVRTKYTIPVIFSLNNSLNYKSINQNIKKDSIDIILKSDIQIDRLYSTRIPKHYSLDDFSKYSLYFSLCENGKYKIILLENYNPAFITSFSISEGNYKIKNDTLLLTDSFTENKLLYQLDSAFIKPVKTYPFMREIIFKDHYKEYNVEKNNISKKITIEKIVSDFEETNIQNNPFEEGAYRYDMIGARFELKLNEEKKYEFNLKVMDEFPIDSKLELYLVFSIGTWERKGNILVLCDTNLQHNFYGLIRRDGTIEFLFFRWGEDMIFKKI